MVTFTLTVVERVKLSEIAAISEDELLLLFA